jgi:hypothetical protein
MSTGVTAVVCLARTDINCPFPLSAPTHPTTTNTEIINVTAKITRAIFDSFQKYFVLSFFLLFFRQIKPFLVPSSRTNSQKSHTSSYVL